MNASLPVRFSACLLSLCGIPLGVGAQTPSEECHTLGVPSTATNWQQPLAFPRFDPANRVLSGVRLQFSGEVRGSVQIESLDAHPASVALQFVALVEAMRPDGTPIWSRSPGYSSSFLLSAFDGTIDFGGTSGITMSNLVVPMSDQLVLGGAPDLTLFTGPAGAPGSIQLTARATGASAVSGPANHVASFNQAAAVDVQLCYLSFPDCNHNGIPDHVDIAAGTTTDCDANLVPDPCQPLDQNNDCDLSGILDACDVLLYGAPDCNGDLVPDWCQLDSNGDGVMDYCQDGGTPYCFGDGALGASACPCATAGAAGAGCPNSTNASGATLAASGLPSSFYDWMRLEGSGMPPNSSVMYFQGTAQASAPTGFGLALGDGLLCATGTIVRLGSRQNTNGQSRLPSNGSTPIRILGQIPPGGGVARYYQAWYRDVNPNYCTPSRYNLTNGVRVDWVL